MITAANMTSRLSAASWFRPNFSVFGSFVEKVREHWWPECSWRKFFWFNTGYFLIIIASVVAYDFLGGSWVVLPLAWTPSRDSEDVDDIRRHHGPEDPNQGQ